MGHKGVRTASPDSFNAQTQRADLMYWSVVPAAGKDGWHEEMAIPFLLILGEKRVKLRNCIFSLTKLYCKCTKLLQCGSTGSMTQATVSTLLSGREDNTYRLGHRQAGLEAKLEPEWPRMNEGLLPLELDNQLTSSRCQTSAASKQACGGLRQT